tara:strand:- start:10025 stop:11362 length:1338 start_codon:yes stop_codon:yes gene_type:complete
MEVQPQSSSTVLDRLEALHPKRIDLSLGRIERLLAALNHPEKQLPPVVHVAGTNGKGSVIAFLEAALQASGYRVHTYISPHLVNFHERIRLAQNDGGIQPIGETELKETLEACEAANGTEPITFFEITTAAAMRAFERHPADVLLLEVGLGGRLDATNVIERPAISVITPVSIDHTQFLGDDLAGIAGEKAGILRTGVPAVIGPQDDVAMTPISDRAAEVGAPLLRCGVEWSCRVRRNGGMVLTLGSRHVELPSPGLPGPHQFANAAMAAVALLAMPGFDVDEDSLCAGLRTAHWPGRLQRIERGPLRDMLPADTELWLDGGHNAAAGQALADAFTQWRNEEKTQRPIFLVSGMLNTKDVSAFFEPFAKAELIEEVYGVPIPGEQASRSGADVTEAAQRSGLNAQIANSVEDAVKSIARRNQAEPARVLICGSLYLAGQVLARGT